MLDARSTSSRMPDYLTAVENAFSTTLANQRLGHDEGIKRGDERSRTVRSRRAPFGVRRPAADCVSSYALVVVRPIGIPTRAATGAHCDGCRWTRGSGGGIRLPLEHGHDGVWFGWLSGRPSFRRRAGARTRAPLRPHPWQRLVVRRAAHFHSPCRSAAALDATRDWAGTVGGSCGLAPARRRA